MPSPMEPLGLMGKDISLDASRSELTNQQHPRKRAINAHWMRLTQPGHFSLVGGALNLMRKPWHLKPTVSRSPR